MFSVRLDASRAKRKLGAMVKARPDSRRAAVVAMTGLIVQRGLVTAPRDTNRYYNGWAMAGNAAGIGRFPVLTLSRSSRFEQIEQRLLEEERYWVYVIQRYRSQGRYDRWYLKAVRRLEAAQREYERLFKAAGGAVIGINTFSAAGSARTARALFKVYGGDGRIVNIENGSATVVFLHNKEPHTSMVEKNTGNMRKAASIVRGTGVVRARAAYLKKALAAMDKAGGGAALSSVGAQVGPAGGAGISVV